MPEFSMLTFDIPTEDIPDSSAFRKKVNFMKGGVFRGEYTYEEISSGVSDGALILSHANGVLVDISWCHDRNSIKWNQLMKSLQRDYQYYFDFVTSETDGTIHDLRDFTEIMLHYDLLDAVYSKIDSYYSEIEKRKRFVRSYALFPGFYKLYRMTGDILLHRRHDYRKAYKYYELISRGSKIIVGAYKNHDYLFHSAEDEEVYLYYADSQYQNIYYQIVQFMDDISYNDLDDINRFDRIFAAYNELIDYYHVTYEDVDQIMDSTDRAFRIFSVFINDYSDDEMYRILGLMSEVLYDKFLMTVLFKMSECSTVIMADYKKNAIRKLSWLKRSDVRNLAEYACQLGSRVSDKEYNCLLGYVKVYNYSRFIEDALKDNESTEKITYYTSLTNFSYMLPQKCKDDKADGLGKLTVMHMSYMNDPTEGKFIGELLCGNISHENNDGRRDAGLPYVFMKCFTSQVDYLPMWNMYGDDAKGVCVVIDWRKSSHMYVPLYNVCYIWRKGSEYEIMDSENTQIEKIDLIRTWVNSMREIVQKTTADRSMIYDLLGNMVFMFKDASYSYEQEKRIIYSYDKANGAFKHTEEQPPKLFIQPDFTVQIDELILGPKFEDVAGNMPYMMEELEKMSSGIDKEMPRITISDINYR